MLVAHSLGTIALLEINAGLNLYKLGHLLYCLNKFVNYLFDLKIQLRVLFAHTTALMYVLII